jgi:hypothetical protein
VDAEEVGEDRLCEEAGDAVEPEQHPVVGQQRHERRREAGPLTEAARDDDREPARGGHVACHGGEADGEHQEHDRGERVRAGSARAVAHERDRRRAERRTHRCRGRDHEEHDPHRPQRAALELAASS